MLLALTTAFAMSQAFRTVAAVLATPLQGEFHLSPQQLGTFAGAFHFAFGAMQLFVGIGIDLHGVRRTVLTGFPLAVAGAVLSALAPSYGALVFGQMLIGIGCAPAFLACTVFIARHFAPARFAAMSGTVMSLGGMLEENLVSSLIKSDGNLLAFFSRPIAATLGVITFAIWLSPLLKRRRAR